MRILSTVFLLAALNTHAAPLRVLFIGNSLTYTNDLPSMFERIAAADGRADELEAQAHFIRYSTTAARNLAGTEALTTYSLAQRLARQKRYAHLKPHVADMRRALGKQRKPTPEETARKAAERAVKAAAKVDAKVAKAALAPPYPTKQ